MSKEIKILYPKVKKRIPAGANAVWYKIFDKNLIKLEFVDDANDFYKKYEFYVGNADFMLTTDKENGKLELSMYVEMIGYYRYVGVSADVLSKIYYILQSQTSAVSAQQKFAEELEFRRVYNNFIRNVKRRH